MSADSKKFGFQANNRVFRSESITGFTIIELVVVAVIISVLFGASLTLIEYQQKSGLQASLEEMTAVVRDVQKKSATQESGVLWGIRFSRPSSGSSKYEVFQGTAYDAGKVVKSLALGRGGEFSGILPGGFFDLFFYPNGAASRDATITISSPGVKFTAVIIVRVSGKIISNMEKGLIGYWLFDEGSGFLALDASSKRRSGSITGTPPPLWETSLNCKSGVCLNFQAANSDLVSGIFQESLSKFSILGWVRVEPGSGGGGRGGIFSGLGSGNGFSGEFISNRIPNFWTEPPAGGENFSLSSSISGWHHLAFVYDGATRRIFVDGLEKGSSLLAGASFSPTSFIMGKRVSVSEFFDGWLDEVKVYNRALDAKEILAQYNSMN